MQRVAPVTSTPLAVPKLANQIKYSFAAYPAYFNIILSFEFN